MMKHVMRGSFRGPHSLGIFTVFRLSLRTALWVAIGAAAAHLVACSGDDSTLAGGGEIEAPNAPDGGFDGGDSVGGDSGDETLDPGHEATFAKSCSDEPTTACVAGEWKVLNPETSTTIHTSEHFAIRWSEKDNVVLSKSTVDEALARFESFWTTYIKNNGFREPYCVQATKYKVDVFVSDRGYATGSGTGREHPALWVHYNALTTGPVIAHEFAHTLQFSSLGLRDSPYVGWAWESHANWMATQVYRDDVNCLELSVDAPHIYYGSTRNRYCNWTFWEFIKDKYCYVAVNEMWSKAKGVDDAARKDETPFSSLARNMGWSDSQLNDEFADWAMRNATWDYRNPDGTDQGAIYRTKLGSYEDLAGRRHLRVTELERIAPDGAGGDAARRFAVPPSWAPQRWGYNLVRLRPDQPNADATLTVTFRGVTQAAAANTSFGDYANQPATVPPPDSDWRWGIVALESSGKRRYSRIHRGSDGKAIFPMKATDSELWLVVMGTPSRPHKIAWDQAYYTIYRYPWMVQLEGALPDGYQAGATQKVPGRLWPNGGGFVADGAKVAPTAYVGPHAKVFGGTVTDKARIEDYATVWSGKVGGTARVSALTMVTGNTTIEGDAHVGTAMNDTSRYGNFTLGGSAILLGDVELRTSLSAGTFYGLVTPETAKDASQGATRTAPSPEVTAPPSYMWRP